MAIGKACIVRQEKVSNHNNRGGRNFSPIRVNTRGARRRAASEAVFSPELVWYGMIKILYYKLNFILYYKILQKFSWILKKYYKIL